MRDNKELAKGVRSREMKQMFVTTAKCVNSTKADKLSKQAKNEANAAAGIVQRAPVLQALRQYPRQIVLAAGAFIGVQVSFYICIAFVVAYGSGASGLGLPKSLMLTTLPTVTPRKRTGAPTCNPSTSANSKIN